MPEDIVSEAVAEPVDSAVLVEEVKVQLDPVPEPEPPKPLVEEQPYAIQEVLDIDSYQVVFDDIGANPPTRLRAIIVKRLIRTDTGVCISTDRIKDVELSDSEVRSFKYFDDLREFLMTSLLAKAMGGA